MNHALIDLVPFYHKDSWGNINNALRFVSLGYNRMAVHKWEKRLTNNKDSL